MFTKIAAVALLMTAVPVFAGTPVLDQREANQRRSEKSQGRRFWGRSRNQDATDFSAWITGSVDVEIIGSGFDSRYQRRLGLRNPALGGNQRRVVG